MDVDLHSASPLLYRNADIEESVWARKGDTLRAAFGSLGSLSVQFV